MGEGGDGRWTVGQKDVVSGRENQVRDSGTKDRLPVKTPTNTLFRSSLDPRPFTSQGKGNYWEGDEGVDEYLLSRGYLEERRDTGRGTVFWKILGWSQ